MKRTVTTLCLFVLGIAVLHAMPIDRTIALTAAQQFSTAQFVNERSTPELVYTGMNASFYVFNIGDHSFVIIAGDDAHRPVIGYSETSAFDATDIPPALTYYLDGVSECILQLHNAVATPDVAAEWASVLAHGTLLPRHGGRGTGYFCQTQWNQDYPYNYCCPDDPNGSGGHAIVGCLATAMSQLMRFWAYPAQGIGSHCYHHDTYGQICADFGNTVYDWDNMPNVLTDHSSEAEKLATGTLCFHCGVTIDMGYGPDGSGGASAPIVSAMHDYFNYCDQIVQLSRNDFETETWKAMVREQFDMGWPMYYGGCQDGGCHAFVCDGYDDKDMFHFNLGWGGGSDGWYLIDDAPYTHPADAMFNFVPSVVYDQTPEAPTAFTAIPTSETDLKVHLTWTNPTTTLNGTALDHLDEVILTRDNEIIQTLTDVTPGTTIEFEDADVPRYDAFHYAVYAKANGRVGKHANVMKVITGPSCPWRIIMASGDNQGWKRGSIIAYTPTGHEIARMTTTSPSATVAEPAIPLGRVNFAWTAPEETVDQLTILIKDSQNQTVYSYEGSSDELPTGVFFATNNNCGNEVTCDIPDNLVATTQDEVILLSWDPVDNPSYGYTVYRDGIPYRLIPSGNTFTDEDPVLGGHCYRVGVLCEGGDSGEYSNESCAMVGPCPPPRNLDFEYTSNFKAKLTWDAPSPSDGLSGYYLFRKEGDGEYHRIKLINPTSSSYTDNSINQEGTYYYRLYAYYGEFDCTSIPANRRYYSNVFEVQVYYSPTGVEEATQHVKVYPNPTKGFITVEAEGMTKISVYNTMGQLIMQKATIDNQETLYLHSLTPGLYLLRINTENGEVYRQITVTN